MSEPLILEHGAIITGGETPHVVEDASILLQDGRIACIANSALFGNVTARRIDARGKIVLPGFVNAHTHCYSAFARGLTGIAPSATFTDVLTNLWWRLDAALTPEASYLSAALTMIEAIRHGTTTIIDHHASSRAIEGSLDEIARARRETGLRACLCYEVSDRDGEKRMLEGIRENSRFIRACADDVSGMVAALFGLHAGFTLSEATLERASCAGRDLKTGFHIHVAEAESDQLDSVKNHGKRVVERLNRHGILGKTTIAAHCVHLSPEEITLLAQTGTAVVHNPQSNLNNAVGIADAAGMARHGVRLALGTDAMTPSMLEEARVALWCRHLQAGEPSAGFSEVLSALTSVNPEIASGIFRRPIGRIAEGAAADLIVVEYIPPTPLNDENAYGHLIYGIAHAPVHTTIVDGEVLMEDGILRGTIDEERIYARSREVAAEIWKRFGTSRSQ